MIDVDLVTLRTRIGEEIATSDWIDITQARIDQFAEATADRQWIHVDQVRAAAESPFRTTIAHGFLTLSLVSVMLQTAMRYRVRMAINYGVNRVRFIAPVAVGSRVRGHFSPLAVEELSGALQITWAVTIECESTAKPCCSVEWIVRYYLERP